MSLSSVGSDIGPRSAAPDHRAALLVVTTACPAGSRAAAITAAAAASARCARGNLGAVLLDELAERALVHAEDDEAVVAQHLQVGQRVLPLGGQVVTEEDRVGDLE